jgi:hypothetical protein
VPFFCVCPIIEWSVTFDLWFVLNQGQTVTPFQLPGNKPYPLVYAADAVVPGTPANVTK